MEWDGVVINAYVKDALKVEVIHRDSEVSYEMRASGIADFFIVATGEKSAFPYKLRATYRDGSTYEYVDAYSFEPVIDNMDLAAFSQGIDYEAYQRLGAHKMTVEGVDGVLFAVWAPNAQRVSVVGEFNMWEGSRGLMRRLSDSSVFELFVPGIEEGAAYKYEIRTHNGDIFMKSDPYAAKNELAPSDVSVIADIQYKFKDGKWIKGREKLSGNKQPLSICEVNLFDFAAASDSKEKTYKGIAKELADYVKKQGYTHVEFSPVMDYTNQAAKGYVTRGFYAVMASLGTPADFKYLVDYLHQKEIGVILDWAPHHFGKEDNGLYLYDGSAAYEDSNPLRAENPAFGTVTFNYGRPEVSNFLISNALYWVEEFHVDGLRVSSLASMLYLDYGRNPGEWLPNIYGSNENLEAVEFFKHLNSIMKKRNPGVLMVADDSSLWADVTSPVEEDGLGFDYKLNLGWTQDMMDYVTANVGDRRDKYNALTFSLLYAYNEQYMYGFGAKECAGGLVERVAGNEIQKYATVKVLLGYMMMQPGKKYIAYGQELCNMLDEKQGKALLSYMKDLQNLYVSEPALYEEDYEEKGFEWINTMRAKDGILVFARKTSNADDTLVVICNFSGDVYENFMLGVPFAGKYKEIFNSDQSSYGGEGNTNARLRQSKKEECDARVNSISTTIPAFGISVYKYNVAGTAKEVKPDKKETAATKKAEPKKKPAAKKTTAVKKAAAKKAEPEKKPVAEMKVEPEKRPVTVKKAEPEKKPAAAKKAEPEKKPVAEKKVEPEKKPVAEIKVEPEKKPAAEKKAEPEKK